MKKRLLLFATHQFGYLTDTLKYCQYAGGQYDITYVGWDYGKTKIAANNVMVKYISRKGNFIQRNYRLLKCLHEEIRCGRYNLVFIHYTRGISLVKLLNSRQPFIFDIRTSSTDTRPARRKLYNFFMKLESLAFPHITVISDGLAAQLGIRRYALLPLGADTIAMTEAKFTGERFNLLYVGTLQNRNILACVKGLHQYMQAFPKDDIVMTIAGDSPGPELLEIMHYIRENAILKEKIVCLGRVQHADLGKHFREAHAGLSFIPLTPWYTCQPPTKTYEYLLSGLPVIATRTREHEKLLRDEERCVLIDDTAEAFAQGIAEMRLKIPQVAANELRERYAAHSWKNVVYHYFMPVIELVH